MVGLILLARRAGMYGVESHGTQAGPKYRLTYWMESGALNGRFEIAVGPGDYKTYMSWTSKKR